MTEDQEAEAAERKKGEGAMIRYSIETLWHFSCDSCGKWWSIGDHQSHDKQELTCPHCGTRSWLAPAEPLETTEPVQAKVDADGWIEWKGGKRPVLADTQVEVQLAEIEEIDSGVACAFAWEHRDSHFNIVAYRVLKKGSAA